MAKRCRHASNSSKADATAVLVKKKVVNTYSRVFPRQVMNKHHFLTPDTPVVEEMELPSHLFQKNDGSVISNLSQCNSKESDSASKAAQQKPASNKTPDCSVHSVTSKELPKAKRMRKAVQNKGQRKRKATKKQTKTQGTSSMVKVNSAYEKNDIATRDRDPQVASRNESHVDPQVALRIQPHTDPQVAPRNESHTSTQVASRNESHTDQQVASRIQPHTDLQVAPRIQPHTGPEVVTDGHVGQTSHSCNLDPVSMEMTCETTVDKASAQPHPSMVKAWSQTCNKDLELTAKKVKFFVETIAAEIKSTETSCIDAGPTQLEVLEDGTSSNAQEPTITNGSETPQRSGDESEIETARARDDQVQMTALDYYERPEAPHRFSVLNQVSYDSDSSGEDAIALLENFPKKSRKRLSIDLSGLCGGLTPTSRSSPSSRNNKNPNLKLSETHDHTMPQAQRGVSLLNTANQTTTERTVFSSGNRSASHTKSGECSRSGRDSASKSALEDHFNKLQMTPIQGPVTSPMESGDSSAKSAAPLTSTPVPQQVCSSSGTPAKSLCAPVNFEHTPDLNAPTCITTAPLLNCYNSDYPLTSTPIYNQPTNTHVTEPRVRLGTTRMGGASSVGSTMMEKLLEFDEVGFQASDELETADNASRALSGTTHKSFGFAGVFSTTSSQTDKDNSIQLHQTLPSNTDTMLCSESDCKVKTFLKRSKDRRLKTIKTAAKKSRSNKGNEHSRRRSLPLHAKKKRSIVPLALRQFNKRRHHRETPMCIRATTSEEKDIIRYTDPKDYPMCILVRMSHEATTQHGYHSLSCDDKSIPKDILTQ